MNIIPRIWCPSEISFYSSSSDTVTASCQPVHQKTQTNPIFFTCMFTIRCYFPFLNGVCRRKERRDVSLWHCLRLRRRKKHDLLVNGDAVYSKMWFILFKRSKYLAADFPSAPPPGPNSAPVLQVIVWTKHRASVPGVTGIGSFIQKEISGETLREKVENYLPLVILLFVETTDLLKWFFLQSYFCWEEIRIGNKFSETERRVEKGIKRMKCLGPHGSCQTQMMQAQGIDLKETKQGFAQGSCSLCMKGMVAEQSSFPKTLEQFLALCYWNLEEEMNQRTEKGQEGRFVDFQDILNVSYATCFLCKYPSVRV